VHRERRRWHLRQSLMSPAAARPLSKVAVAVPALPASLLATSQVTFSVRALAATLQGTTLAALSRRQLEIGSSMPAVAPDELQGGCSCV
jgi:hypothetical protein